MVFVAYLCWATCLVKTNRQKHSIRLAVNRAIGGVQEDQKISTINGFDVTLMYAPELFKATKWFVTPLLWFIIIKIIFTHSKSYKRSSWSLDHGYCLKNCCLFLNMNVNNIIIYPFIDSKYWELWYLTNNQSMSYLWNISHL